MAEMVAARIFNEREGNDISIIYGVITTGMLWKFVKLEENRFYIDLRDYSILDNPKKIIGMFSSMLRQMA